MATITLTDTAGLTAALQINDDSFLAKAGLQKLVADAKSVILEFGKPAGQAMLKEVELGPAFTSPDLLSSGPWTLKLAAGILPELTVATAKDGTLFGTDKVSPAITIEPNQAWVSFKVAVNISAAASATVNAFGVAVKANSAIACTTFALSPVAGQPAPTLRDAFAACLSDYSVATGHDAIRKQRTGTINQTEISGSLTLKATVAVPCTLNALAAADVPLHTTVSVQPDVTAQVSGTVKVSGDFIFRSHKLSDTEVRIGMYKKRGISLAATFTAGAGLEGEAGSTDVLGTILNHALPGIDLVKVGLHDAASGQLNAQAAALNAAIKDNIDGTLTAQVNACFSSALTNQAAVVYTVRLEEGDTAATNGALDQALGGNWSALAHLGNATRDGALTVDTVEKKGSLTLNLFGVYSATAVSDYIKSCTVLVDPTGQVSLVNSTETSRIRASAAPYASDTNKLRKALLDDFVCTATYAAVAGALQLQLSANQFYLSYQQTMNSRDMKRNVLIGYALNTVPKGAMNDVLSANAALTHAWVDAAIRYNQQALLNVFFSDPVAMQARLEPAFEDAGRKALTSLLDPEDADDRTRLRALEDDTWQQMSALGNTAQFGKISQFKGFAPYQVDQIAKDWECIRWWAPVIATVGPVLRDTLQAVKNTTARDPTNDPRVMQEQKRLAEVLGAVTRASSPAFIGTPGWSEAVMFTLSQQTGTATMEFVWDKNRRAFPA